MKFVSNSLTFGCSLSLLTAVLASVFACANLEAQQTNVDAFFASQIWTGTGEPINDAVIVVEDGLIAAIGPRDSVEIPAIAKRHDFGSQVLIPGLVIAQTNLGGTQAEDRTITPQIRSLDGFDFFADRDVYIENGITTVQVSPAQNRLMPGVGSVVKLVGEELDARVLQEEESLQIVLTSAARRPPRIYEPAVGPVSEDRPLNATRPQVSTLPASLAVLRQIFKAAASGEASDDVVIATVAEMI